MTSLRVRVPATSANLGPGFDTLGIALAYADELTVTTVGSGVKVRVHGVGEGEVPTDETNLVARSAAYVFEKLGREMPGIEIEAHNRIPHGRGMGSSGSAIVSCSGASQPTVRASAKVPVSNCTGMPMARCTMPE